MTTFTVITRAVGFIFKIYLSNILTPSELGIYTVTISVYMLLLTIVSSSLPTTISRTISQSNISQNTKNKFVSNSLIISIILSVIIIAFVMLCKPIFNLIFTIDMSYTILLYLLPSIFFMAIYSPIMGYFWGNNDYFQVSIVEFIEQIIRIGISLLLIYLNPFNNLLISICLGLSIACVISSVYGIIVYKLKKGNFKYTIKYTKIIVKSSLPLLLMRIVSSIIQPIINVIVPICLVGIGYSNSESLALIGIIFGMCMPIITIPSTIIGAINMALLPEISYNSNNPTILNTKIKSNYKLIMLCSFIFLPIFLVLSEPICELLYSNVNISYYLVTTMWLIVPTAINQYFSSIMNALGKETKNFIYSTISSVIMIIIILLTTRYLEIFALPLGLGINAIIASVLEYYEIKKTVNLNFNPLSDVITNTLIILPIIILNYFIYNIFMHIIPNILLILLISSISIIAYIILIVTFQYIDIDYILKATHKKAIITS